MIKAVIFDFDGTILDTETPWYESFCEIYKEHGAHLPIEKWASCVGSYYNEFDPYNYLQECIQKPVDRSIIHQSFQTKYAAMMKGRTIRPGVEQYLLEAKALNLKIGLATSSTKEWIDRYLNPLGLLPYFDCIRTSDDVANVKPDPELYVQAMQCLEVSPSEAVAFEDSPTGTKAAKNAGMHCVIVPNPITVHLPFEAFDLRLDAMTDLSLKEVIARLC